MWDSCVYGFSGSVGVCVCVCVVAKVCGVLQWSTCFCVVLVCVVEVVYL